MQILKISLIVLYQRGPIYFYSGSSKTEALLRGPLFILRMLLVHQMINLLTLILTFTHKLKFSLISGYHFASFLPKYKPQYILIK